MRKVVPVLTISTGNYHPPFQLLKRGRQLNPVLFLKALSLDVERAQLIHKFSGFVAMDSNGFSHLNNSQLESVRKMAGIFGMEALQSLLVSSPSEQIECVNAFDAYEQGLIAHVRMNLQASAA
ncbi:hypothetical protein PInf_003788 [Phytophthora infestans]|nr:hypothetical protein PInf_003788 [Phytophthora infestans]